MNTFIPEVKKSKCNKFISYKPFLCTRFIVACQDLVTVAILRIRTSVLHATRSVASIKQLLMLLDLFYSWTDL